MFHIVYKVTNLINNKIYIGIHSTEDLSDNYYGSGKYIKESIKKYGKENFKKEIICYCGSREEAFEKEKQLVDKQFIERNDVYNLSLGGKGSLECGCVRIISLKGIQKIVKIEELDYYTNNGWRIWSKGYCRYFDKDNNQYWLLSTDPLIEKLSLKAWTKGKKVMVDKDGKTIQVDKDKVTEDMISIVKDTITVKDSSGKYYRVNKNDERYLTGEFVGVNKGRKGLADHLNKKLEKCKYCGIETSKGNIKRWHDENCKKKKNIK